MIALGITLPGLMLQDCWRFAFVTAGRSHLAFLNDLIWAIALFPSLFIIIHQKHSSVSAFTLAWGATATVAGLLGMAQAHLVPRPHRLFTWWREQKDLGKRYFLEFVTYSGIYQATTYGIGVAGGLVALGTLRAGDLLIGPFNVFFMGAMIAAVAEGSRIARRSIQSLNRASILFSIALTILLLVWAAILLLIPTALGETLLGANWSSAMSVIVPLLFVALGRALQAGPVSGLRALAAARESLLARLASSPLILVGGVTGTVVGGAVGAAWGMAIGNGIGAAVWWWVYTRASARAELERRGGFGGEENVRTGER